MSQQFFESEPLQKEEVPTSCSFCGSKETRCATCGRICASKRSQKRPNVPWKKVLYEKQSYEDNYLDETFLSSLVSQKETSAKLTYSEVAMQAMEVSLATSFVSLYLLVFMGMLNKLADSAIIVSINTLILLTGVMVSVLLGPNIVNLKNIFMNLKSGAIVIGFILLLSPMIQAFFQNYVENIMPVHAIPYALVLIHLILRDYAYVHSKENSETTRMDWSTLAITFLAVILSLRLIKEGHGVGEVFILWLSTLTLFVFARAFQKILREYSLKVYNYTALTFIIGMGAVIYSISNIGIIVYAFTNFIIFVIGPLGLVWFYQYKNAIHGPWDLPDVKQIEE